MGQETITYLTNIIIGVILAGLLPICAWCKKARNGEGYWQQVEDYFSTRSHMSSPTAWAPRA